MAESKRRRQRFSRSIVFMAGRIVTPDSGLSPIFPHVAIDANGIRRCAPHACAPDKIQSNFDRFYDKSGRESLRFTDSRTEGDRSCYVDTADRRLDS
ncbi:MAG TPA: hypothetical protein VGL08_21220 [Paraburkholderia sp.]